MKDARPIARMFAGPAAWAAHFIATYGVIALACERAPQSAPHLVPVAILVLSLAAAAVAALGLSLPRRKAGASRPLAEWLGAATAALALAAIVAQGTPAMLMPACR